MSYSDLVDATYVWLSQMERVAEPSDAMKYRFIAGEILRCRTALEEIVKSKKSNWCAKRAAKALEGRE